MLELLLPLASLGSCLQHRHFATSASSPASNSYNYRSWLSLRYCLVLCTSLTGFLVLSVLIVRNFSSLCLSDCKAPCIPPMVVTMKTFLKFDIAMVLYLWCIFIAPSSAFGNRTAELSEIAQIAEGSPIADFSITINGGLIRRQTQQCVYTGYGTYIRPHSCLSITNCT